MKVFFTVESKINIFSLPFLASEGDDRRLKISLSTYTLPLKKYNEPAVKNIVFYRLLLEGFDDSKIARLTITIFSYSKDRKMVEPY